MAGGCARTGDLSRLRLRLDGRPAPLAAEPGVGGLLSRRLPPVSQTIRWTAVAIDCADAGPVARFYERLLGFELRAFEPPGWAQLFDQSGGMHLNIQGERWYEAPKWPEQPGEQTKMLHFEIEVDDLEAAVARAQEGGGTEAPWQPPDRNRDRIRIMLDPAGHPLCLFLQGE